MWKRERERKRKREREKERKRKRVRKKVSVRVWEENSKQNVEGGVTYTIIFWDRSIDSKTDMRRSEDDMSDIWGRGSGRGRGGREEREGEREGEEEEGEEREEQMWYDDVAVVIKRLPQIRQMSSSRTCHGWHHEREREREREREKKREDWKKWRKNR
jgi:hypothetical protein